jgi:predicted Zn-dependent protease
VVDERLVRPALAVQPDYPDLHLALAHVESARGQLERAAAGCRAALELRPAYSAAALELARIELARGRPDRAEPLLGVLASRHPRWADAHALLGRARRLRGDAAGAQEPLRTALELNPGYVQARDERAAAVVGENEVTALRSSRGRRALGTTWMPRTDPADPEHAIPGPMP